MVLGSIGKQTAQLTITKELGSIHMWSLLQLQPPGSCVVWFLSWLPLMMNYNVEVYISQVGLFLPSLLLGTSRFIIVIESLRKHSTSANSNILHSQYKMLLIDMIKFSVSVLEVCLLKTQMIFCERLFVFYPFMR